MLFIYEFPIQNTKQNKICFIGEKQNRPIRKNASVSLMIKTILCERVFFVSQMFD